MSVNEELQRLLEHVTAPGAPALRASRRVGAYELLSLIGKGGMGLVFEAKDTRLHRTVALKVIRPEICGDSRARRRFVREARAAAAVHHDHIVPVYETDETPDGLLYLVMP